MIEAIRKARLLYSEFLDFSEGFGGSLLRSGLVDNSLLLEGVGQATLGSATNEKAFTASTKVKPLENPINREIRKKSKGREKAHPDIAEPERDRARNSRKKARRYSSSPEERGKKKKKRKRSPKRSITPIGRKKGK